MPLISLPTTPRFSPAECRRAIEEFYLAEELTPVCPPSLDKAIAGIVHIKGQDPIVVYDAKLAKPLLRDSLASNPPPLLDQVNATQPLTRETLEYLLEVENPEALFANGFDPALLGVLRRPGFPTLVIYDLEKVIECCVTWGMDYEEAEEYVSFNVTDSYNGTSTPGFLVRPWEDLY